MGSPGNYADQRFYASTYGRFLTADPAARGAASPTDSGSWNRYAYTRGDPINRVDPHETCDFNALESYVDEGGNVTFSDVCIDYEPTISDMCAQYAMYGSAAVTDPNFQQYCLGGAQLQQSQGGGGASPIDIDNGIIASIFAGLEDLLKRDPTCEKWRASGIAGGDLGAVNFDIQQAAAGSGAAYLPAKITAVTNIGFAYPGYPSSPLASYPAITINANGAFFQPGPVGFYANAYQSQIGQLIGGTVQAEDFILLHELAHYLGVRGYAPNDGPRGVQGANNAILYQNCNKTINAVHN